MEKQIKRNIRLTRMRRYMPTIKRYRWRDNVRDLFDLAGESSLEKIDIHEIKRLTTVEAAWNNIYNDLNKSVSDYAKIHKLSTDNLPLIIDKIDVKNGKRFNGTRRYSNR